MVDRLSVKIFIKYGTLLQENGSSSIALKALSTAGQSHFNKKLRKVLLITAYVQWDPKQENDKNRKARI